MNILCANFLDKSAYWVRKISLGKIIGGACAPCAPPGSYAHEISLKFCESFRFFHAVFMEKIQKIHYLSYVRKRVVLIPLLLVTWCSYRLEPKLLRYLDQCPRLTLWNFIGHSVLLGESFHRTELISVWLWVYKVYIVLEATSDISVRLEMRQIGPITYLSCRSASPMNLGDTVGWMVVVFCYSLLCYIVYANESLPPWFGVRTCRNDNSLGSVEGKCMAKTR